jgi:hypothetical protein
MSDTRLVGCGTALATPFTPGGDVDERALRGFVDWQIDEGIDFLVPCGSTGEAATMSLSEQRRVVELTAEQTRGRVSVVAGRLQRHQTGDRAFEGDAGRGRDPPPSRIADVQQAAAARHHRALPRRRRRDGAADHRLQRARPDSKQH